ncbi:membrane protein insertion efficiency factor YidD [Deinococcus koreensis]|uniref:Membrane protein insertion efficiency factor YidD n=1 Tax=Deinococcus koreensis TaxID=2054903 RepID=A0A2K3UUI0_9DEIO|nr:membrane protein insertion efficiency factor YidD [Deinococcus koreensis]PNY80189.1 hypothetical protein CVO96_01395 [Deinococcus koreensis]
MNRFDALVVRAIGRYQRSLSPHKGFRCAHAALHGGPSCSAQVARIVRQQGLVGGRRAVADQFRACRAAHRTLWEQARFAAPGGGSPLAFGSAPGGPRVRGVCCCGPLPIPFRCG